MSGPKGRVNGTKVASDQIDYYIPSNGNYYIYITSSTPNSNVEFCAY